MRVACIANLAVRAVVDDRFTILTVNRVLGFIMYAQCLVVGVFEGARVDTRRVRWCGIAGYHRRREHGTHQEGKDREEGAHLCNGLKVRKAAEREKRPQKSLNFEAATNG